MKKVTRSLWGAALGTFMSLWPAATFALTSLVIPGAFFGWLLGYHGDRIWRGLKQGGKKVRQDVYTYPHQVLESVSGVAQSAIGAGRIIFKGSVWLLKHGLGITLVYRCWQWLQAHPVNRATIITVVMNFTGLGLLIYGLFMMGNYITKSGASVLSVNTMTLLSGIPFLVAFSVAVFSLLSLSSHDSHGQFYGRWDRYNRFKFLYPVVELGRYLYVALWTYVMVLGCVLALVIVAVTGALYFCIATTVFGLIRHTVRFSWRAMRYNRDYGIVSLVVAVMTGLVVYHNHEIQMVADPVFRLLASAVSALAAGSVAAMATLLIPIWFRLSYKSRQLLRYKGDVTTWLLDRTLGKNKLGPVLERFTQKFQAAVDRTRPNYAFND